MPGPRLVIIDEMAVAGGKGLRDVRGPGALSAGPSGPIETVGGAYRATSISNFLAFLASTLGSFTVTTPFS